MMKRYGFLFDTAVCVGCKACQFACREENGLIPGSYFRRVLLLEPEHRLGYTGFYSAGCAHCQEPACVKACPNGAMYRDEEQGVILHNDGRCIGCGACVWACPYGAVSVDCEKGKAHKCSSCLSRREQGRSPACTAACPTGALRFGPVEDLEKAGGRLPPAEYLPDGGRTNPSFRVRDHAGKGGEP